MKIDARGLSCPQPVLLTQQAVASNNEIEVIVDNETAKENVSRFATSKGFSVEVSEDANEEFTLKLKK